MRWGTWRCLKRQRLMCLSQMSMFSLLVFFYVGVWSSQSAWFIFVSSTSSSSRSLSRFYRSAIWRAFQIGSMWELVFLHQAVGMFRRDDSQIAAVPSIDQKAARAVSAIWWLSIPWRKRCKCRCLTSLAILELPTEGMGYTSLIESFDSAPLLG